MKILLSAFACKPYAGSEGVGWRWDVELAKLHEVVVVTDVTRREAIEAELAGRCAAQFRYCPVALHRLAIFAVAVCKIDAQGTRIRSGMAHYLRRISVPVLSWLSGHTVHFRPAWRRRRRTDQAQKIYQGQGNSARYHKQSGPVRSLSLECISQNNNNSCFNKGHQTGTAVAVPQACHRLPESWCRCRCSYANSCTQIG